MKKFLVLLFVVFILLSISKPSHAREWISVGEKGSLEVFFQSESVSRIDTRWGIGYKATVKIVAEDESVIDYYTVSEKHCKAKRGKLDIYMETGVFVKTHDFRIGEDELYTHVADALCNVGKLIFH